jgi:signal transduction histidine kinase/HAMP domain-containing protein
MIIKRPIDALRRSIRARLSFLIILVSFAPVMIVGLLATRIARDRLTDEALLRIRTEAAAYGSQLENYAAQQRINLLSYSSLPSIQGRIRAVQNGNIDPATFNSAHEWDDLLLNYFGSIARSKQQYASLEYADAEGIINALAFYERENQSINLFSKPSINYDISERAYFSEASQLANGEIYTSPIGYVQLEVGTRQTTLLFGMQMESQAMFFMATPIYSREGEFSGVVSMGILAETLYPFLRTTLGNVYLTDTAGHYLYHPNPEKRYTSDTQSLVTLAQDYPEIWADIQQTGIIDFSTVVGNDVIAVIKLDSSFLPTERNVSYWLIRTVPVDTVFSPVRSMTVFVLAGAVTTLIPMLGLALLVSQGFTRPIRKLTRAAEIISHSNHRQILITDQVVKVKSDDEIGRLAQSFNLMTQNLISSLNESNQLLEIVNNRTKVLEVSVELSRQITTVLNETKLLPKLVELTRESFGFYQVSIFRYHSNTQMLSLVASSVIPELVITHGEKSFRIDDIGLVPLAARSYTAAVNNDISRSANDAENFVLPNTRSEVALPILFGGSVLGVLDIQSRKENRFSEQDVMLYTSYANQIAVAIRNAILFEEVIAAKDKAEQADNIKSSFLANMSHELRTPLNVIINFSKFLRTGTPGHLNLEQQQLINAIADSGQLLLNLINDILDMSKIEAGLLRLFVEDNIDIGAILKNAIEYTKPALVDKPVTLYEATAPDLPPIKGDRKRLLQIFLNILSNACKFTQKGYIRVSTKIEGDYLLVMVADTGVGIAPEDWGDVFTPFKQAESGLRQDSGTGLGMPICKSLVEAHNGRIWFESQLEQGTTFFVRLPILTTSEKN